MQGVLEEPFIVMTDHKIVVMEQLNRVLSMIEKSGRPLLIIAEEAAPPVIMQLLSRREKTNFKVAAIHPPEYGRWRKAMLEDIAIATGGKVISVDLGGKLERAELSDRGSIVSTARKQGYNILQILTATPESADAILRRPTARRGRRTRLHPIPTRHRPHQPPPSQSTNGRRLGSYQNIEEISKRDCRYARDSDRI
jgi:hypothetical protein